MKKENFERLRSGLIDRLKLYSGTLEDFFTTWSASGGAKFNKLTLLDHMDWLASVNIEALRREWHALMLAASPDARIIWRGGGTDTSYVDTLKIQHKGRERKLGELMTKDHQLAGRLHRLDRVHTYGSFHIAQLALN